MIHGLSAVTRCSRLPRFARSVLLEPVGLEDGSDSVLRRLRPILRRQAECANQHFTDAHIAASGQPLADLFLPGIDLVVELAVRQ